jgi:CRISPR-associated protein Csb3
MRFSLEVNPFNPVEFLACCGLFEILARFDPTANGWWSEPHEKRFLLESRFDEDTFLDCLKETLRDGNSWCGAALSPESESTLDDESQEFKDSDPVMTKGEDEEEEGEVGAGEGNDIAIIRVVFCLDDQTRTYSLDWWYETLKQDRTIKEKSGWKMYAGNQTVERIVRKMTAEIETILSRDTITNLTGLLQLSTGMTGRFGFDPRSTRNALEAGYSPNDLKIPVPTYPVAELLAGIGANYFFPARTRPGCGTRSTRGWVEDKIFQYALWQTPLPLTLARLAAAGRGVIRDSLIFLHADRVSRDKYSNFKMARIGISTTER